MGLFHDPEAAARAHQIGEGARLRLSLGGRSPGQVPVEAEFEVIALSDGKCRFTGEMYGGGVATLGPTAALRLVGQAAQIDLVVTSIRNQCLDQALFTHLKLEPRSYRVVCVKSTVHFRADFDPIASETHAVAAPGLFLCDLEQVSYKTLCGKRITTLLQ